VRAHPGEAPENLNVTSPCTRPFALRLALPALVAAAVLSAGCSTVDGWMSGSKVDYKSGATRAIAPGVGVNSTPKRHGYRPVNRAARDTVHTAAPA